MNRIHFSKQQLRTPWGRCALWWTGLIAFKVVTAIFPMLTTKLLGAYWYPFEHLITRFICGSFGCSIGDILYAMALIYMILKLVFRRRTPWSWPKFYMRIAQAYALFWLCWGFQYDQPPQLPLSETLDTPQHQQQLFILAQQLVDQTNQQWAPAQQHPLDFTALEGQTGVFYQAHKAVQSWPKAWCALSPGVPLMLKPSGLSQGITRMGFGGYLNPFTLESQVNMHQPQVLIPAVACHELAHQQGIASEGMCNYMSYWATQHSGHPAMAYSGSLSMLRYALAAVQTTQPQGYQKLRLQLCAGVQADLLSIKAFWQQHQNPAQTFFIAFYDHFLQWNHEPKGVEAYAECLQLLLQHPIQ